MLDQQPTLDGVERAISAFGDGSLVIVVDHPDREDEGDLVCLAETVTTEQVGFMIRHTSGIICVPMTAADLDRLAPPPMAKHNEEGLRTAFTVSVDARAGITTGVSAAERAHTIRSLADPTLAAEDFVRPGHVFPLRYRPGGVLVRPGHTEAAVDLARLAGRRSAAALAELVNDDGTMMRGPALRLFASQHHLHPITIAELVRYRRHQDAATTPRGT